MPRFFPALKDGASTLEVAGDVLVGGRQVVRRGRCVTVDERHCATTPPKPPPTCSAGPASPYATTGHTPGAVE
ncbi:hypothetical protein [Streptosporangium sp. NPDC006007]|uniref:hypothetical protein n=1 Tax=Streptosporangium sp. NPDC006007 TaxID=3154575 RepID=UPI0033B25664